MTTADKYQLFAEAMVLVAQGVPLVRACEQVGLGYRMAHRITLELPGQYAKARGEARRLRRNNRPHGAGGYVRGCRCALCTKANASRLRKWRASHRGLLPRAQCSICGGEYACRYGDMFWNHVHPGHKAIPIWEDE